MTRSMFRTLLVHLLAGAGWWLALAHPAQTFPSFAPSNCSGCHGNPDLLATPGNGQTLSFGNAGHTLVGQSSTAGFTLKNNKPSGGGGFSGSFPGTPAGSEFSPSSSLAITGTNGYLTPQLFEQRIYSYTPTARGADSQAISFTPANGFTILNGVTTAPTVTITLSGQGVAPLISLDGSQTAAGNVRLGTSHSALGIAVGNVGDGNLSGLGDSSNLKGSVAAVAGVFTGAGANFNLPDAASQAHGFAFTPTARGAVSQDVAVDAANGNSNGSNAAQQLTVSLSGTGVGPSFASSITPGSTLDFGPLAGAGSRSMSISNATPDPDLGAQTRLTLLSFELSGTDAGLFSLPTFAAGMALDKNDLFNLEVAFGGSGAPGLHTALLTLVTDEGAALGASGAAFSYTLAATAVTPVPEPAAFAMLLAGLAGMALRMRRLRR